MVVVRVQRVRGEDSCCESPEVKMVVVRVQRVRGEDGCCESPEGQR